MSLDPKLTFALRCFSRLVYFVTEEEDRFLVDLMSWVQGGKKKSNPTTIKVYDQVVGMIPADQYIRDWSPRVRQFNAETRPIYNALDAIYQDNPGKGKNIYVITDPERWMTDAAVVRRLLSLAHQGIHDPMTVKVVVLVSNQLTLPQKLQRYVEVVHDRGLQDEDIWATLDQFSKSSAVPVSPDMTRHFRGMTSAEIQRIAAGSVVHTLDTKKQKEVDLTYVQKFKCSQLGKTSLVNFVDVDNVGFSDVGGADQFKEWVTNTHVAWTDEGHDFGLEPPKGVLCVGVWGCGKSLSVKALAHEWHLPLVQLEMGKLRSSRVGETEGNIYRALQVVESVAPCVLWVDEAEKSLSGSESSAQSDAGTTSRALGIFSTWIQETKSQVCLAMTVNDIKALQLEFINRMDERFFFGMPEEEERMAILEIHLRKRKQDPSKYSLLSLAKASEGMVGREIEQALKAAMRDSYLAKATGVDEAILKRHLESKPRIFQTMKDRVQEVSDWVGWDDRIGEGIRARYASKRVQKSPLTRVK